MNKDALVIGLTGSFGSGCSTLAEGLENHHGFARYSLSTPIRSEWDSRNPNADKAPQRPELQDIGNEIRRNVDPSEWANRVFSQIQAAHPNTGKIVIDSIKNEAEVAFYRRRFPDFFLVAVQAPQDSRWRRVREQYEAAQRSYSDFEDDDIRDQVEDVIYGQQVQLCVDDADIAVNNEADRQSHRGAVRAMGSAIEPYLGLMTQEQPRAASKDEVAMTTAYIQSRRSMCLKRHVGAVITDQKGSVLCTGYNENPEPMTPCYIHFGYCHKDSEMIGMLENLEGTVCPSCAERLPRLDPPFRCPLCGLSLRARYAPDRGMRSCTALHAEERAIQNAGGVDLHETTLYSTTFPCFNCARQIVHRGIKRVVYVEPYPNKEGLWLFQQTGMEITLFEGVKARAFERLFKPFRRKLEDQYDLEGKEQP